MKTVKYILLFIALVFSGCNLFKEELSPSRELILETAVKVATIELIESKPGTAIKILEATSSVNAAIADGEIDLIVNTTASKIEKVRTNASGTR